MTDLEITRWLAEKVMGWTYEVKGGWQRWRKSEKSYDTVLLTQWLPLTDPRACAEVMAALRAKGWSWTVGGSGQGVYAEVFSPNDTTRHTEKCVGPWTRRFPEFFTEVEGGV